MTEIELKKTDDLTEKEKLKIKNCNRCLGTRIVCTENPCMMGDKREIGHSCSWCAPTREAEGPSNMELKKQKLDAFLVENGVYIEDTGMHLWLCKEPGDGIVLSKRTNDNWIMTYTGKTEGE